MLRRHATEEGYEIVAIIKYVGSGLRENCPGLRKLFCLVTEKHVGTVLVTYRDKLTRFGFEYLRYFFEKYNVDIVKVL